MVCLESDFLIEFSRRKPEAISKMQKLVQDRESLFVTPITATELLSGVFRSKDILNELMRAEELLLTLKFLEYDLSAAKMAAELMADLSKKGEKIGDMDTLTAGIAMRHNQTIVTRNKKHFSRISGLKLDSW